MSCVDNSNVLFAIFAILLFIVLVLVYIMFGPLPNQSKFLSDSVNESITVVGLLDLQTDAKGNNIVIGNNAGTKIDSSKTGIQNTIIGGGAANNLTEGGANTIIGNQAGVYITTGDNNLILGASAGPATNKSDSFYVNTGLVSVEVTSATSTSTSGDKIYVLGYNSTTGQIIPLDTNSKVLYAPTTAV
jgi:hypothetical protein